MKSEELKEVVMLLEEVQLMVVAVAEQWLRKVVGWY